MDQSQYFVLEASVITTSLSSSVIGLPYISKGRGSMKTLEKRMIPKIECLVEPREEILKVYPESLSIYLESQEIWSSRTTVAEKRVREDETKWKRKKKGKQ